MTVNLVKHLPVTAEIQDYVIRYGTAEDDVLRWISERTAEFGRFAIQQIVPEEGALLTMLTRLTEAKFAVEVGTFTGYSSVCIARGLAAEGNLLCCDRSEEWTAVAREAWLKAGLTDRVELVLGDATTTLRALPPDRSIDFSFIDADLVNHAEYYAELVERTRPGGVLVIDNTLLRGRVLGPDRDEGAELVHQFNVDLAEDSRVDVVLLPFHDGVTIARRR